MRTLVALFLALFPVHAFATVSGFFKPDPDVPGWLSSPGEPEFTSAPEARASANCRDRIASIMCSLPELPGNDRPRCRQGGESYASHFVAIHDALPGKVRSMFCAVKVIYVLDSFYGTAFAGMIRGEDGEILGAQMGIRASVLNEGLSLEQWSTWKEQLSFGGKPEGYETTEGLPYTRTATEGPVNDFLYFTVVHEFGHMFDLANDLNNYDCQSVFRGGRCEPIAGSWTLLSWKNRFTPRAEFDFPNRDGLCFYRCGDQKIPYEAIPQLYEDLFIQSNFISTYAATNPLDDFAESLAYYLMDKHLGTKYELHTAQGTAYNVMAKLRSPIFAQKYQYIEKFLERADIRYPGEN